MKQNDSARDRVIRASMLPPEQVSEAFHLPKGGLYSDQVEKLREQYGENRVSTQRKDTVLYRMRRAFVNPFSIVLLIVAFISFITGVLFDYDFSHSGFSAAIILIILIVSGTIRLVQELRARYVTGELEQKAGTTVQVRRDGVWTSLPSDALVVGDRVRLDAGDRVPADIRLLESTDFFVAQGMLTGQSDILGKSSAPLSEPPDELSEFENTVFLGSMVSGGRAEGVVLATGAETTFGGISPEPTDHKTGFDRSEKSITLVLIGFMVVLVPVVFLAVGLMQGNWLEAFLFALSVTVGLMPELLPMVVTACLTRGGSMMGKKQTLVKSVNAIQGFGCMDVLCVDKTGTLTGDTVRLEYYMDVLGNESSEVLDCAFLNSAYHTGLYNHLDTAILESRKMRGREPHSTHLLGRFDELDELPFDYKRHFASVLLGGDDEQILIIKGSVDEVTERCTHFRCRDEQYEIGKDRFENVHAIVDDMQEDGMKVLAVAAKRLEQKTLAPEDEYDLTLLGYVAFFDPPKQSAGAALERLQDLHIDVKVLTGDHSGVAASICRRLGISAEHIVTGRELDSCSEDELSSLTEQGNIFAELSPQQKVRVVRALQANGHNVGFLGDGMNDLPAVVQAQVGISVDTAAEAVQDNADVVLLKKDLNVLGDGVTEGRRAFVNISKYIKITASSNFGHILTIFIAAILLPFLPTTAVQLLALNLVYDILCLVIPWDHVEPLQMSHPLEWSGRTLGRFMGYFGPISSIFDFLTFGFLFFLLCPAICGGAFSTLDTAGQMQFAIFFRSGWFLESIWSQVLVLLALRSERLTPRESRPSRLVVTVMLVGVLVCTALAVSPLGGLLGLTALPLTFYPFLIVSMVLYLLLILLVKKWHLRRYHRLI